MTLPSSSETLGTGGIIATNTIAGKEYQVINIADADGHLIGSRPDYLAFFPPATNALNRTVAELWNGSTSGILRIRGMWIIPTVTVITGVAIEFAFARTAVAGTAGTAVTPNPMDTNATALPTGVAARVNSTVAISTELFRSYAFNDETNAAIQLQQYQNQLPQLGDRVGEIVLRPNNGFKIQQMIAATVGLTGAMVMFSVDN